MEIIQEKYEEEMKKKAFNDILSHKAFVQGNCFECGKEYAFCTNKKSSDRDLYCSDKCYNKFKKDKIRRNKEKHHYEVYKDDKFYYLVEDGEFNTKRSFEGKSWIKKFEQDKQREDDVIKRISDWKHPILPEKATIPKQAIKIVDKVSVFLYDDKHKFSDWKNLKRCLVPKLSEGVGK